MSQYYFLVSSLPILFENKKSYITVEEFLPLCETQLTGKDFKILQNTHISPISKKKPSCTSLDKWQAWEKSLRNELVKLRARNLGKDPRPYLREVPFFTEIHSITQEAFNEESLLTAEDILFIARWQKLSELEAGHFFDIDKIVIYYLKLQLLQGKNLFNFEEGKQFFETLYNDIIDKLKTEVVNYG